MHIPQRWFRPGDIDGLIALGLENFIQVLLIVTLCRELMHFPAWLIYGRMLPGVAVSMILGNVYYGWLALRENKRQQRDDMTALPYGVSIISLLAYIFLVMLPTYTAAIAHGFPEEQAAIEAWRAGLVACLGCGLIKLMGLASIQFLQRYVPLASHLSTLASISLTFIAMGFFLRTFAHPVISLVPLGIILLTFLGQVKFAIPGGLLAVLMGTVLAWGVGFMQWDGDRLVSAMQPIGIYLPGLWLGDLWQGREALINYLTIIVPISLFDFINNFQNLESADAAGDAYPKIPALFCSGLFTVVAALCGSCFPTTLYIGHPGIKAMGARAGYSFLTALFAAVLSLTGTAALLAYFVPIEAGMAIYILIAVFIVVQSFSAPPAHHAPAVVIGLLPGIAAWGAIVAKDALRSAEMGTPQHPFSEALVTQFQQHNLFIHGVFALEQGYILTSIILSAIVVWIIEQEFYKAALWAFAAALLSWFGLMHSYRWTTADTVGNFGWGVGQAWAVGYCLLAILFFYTAWRTQHFPSTSKISPSLSNSKEQTLIAKKIIEN